MPFYSACVQYLSSNKYDNAKSAVERLKDELRDPGINGILVFAASNYHYPTLATELRKAFPNAQTFGCSSAGEYACKASLNQSVVALAFTPDKIAAVHAVGIDHIDYRADAVDLIAEKYYAASGMELDRLDHHDYVGWIMLDGLSHTFDNMLSRLGAKTDILFAGGLAGDGGQFTGAWVWANGVTYENGAVFAVFQPRGKFHACRIQSVKSTGISITPTKVDPVRNIIYEFDGQPATQVYARAMGLDIQPDTIKYSGKSSREIYAEAIKHRTSPDVLLRSADGILVYFSHFPLAICADGDILIRPVTSLAPNGGLRCYMPPIEGVRYTVCRITDPVPGLQQLLADTRAKLGGISGACNMNSLIRHIQMEKEGKVDETIAMFADIPLIATSCYGQIYLSAVCQSSVYLFFQ